MKILKCSIQISLVLFWITDTPQNTFNWTRSRSRLPRHLKAHYPLLLLSYSRKVLDLQKKYIKGITIDKHDNTTVLLSDVQSVPKLFDLLSLFERWSGLRLNQAKSEMLRLGLYTKEKIPYLTSKWVVSQFTRLGVHFAYNPAWKEKTNWPIGICKENIESYVVPKRGLSIFHRINRIKALALLKLVFICSVMNTPKDFSRGKPDHGRLYLES